MSDVLTAVTAAVTGARMPTGDVRRLSLTTSRGGGTDWEMTVVNDGALTVHQGSVRWGDAMVAVRARVLHALDTRPTLILGIDDAGNHLVLTDITDQGLVAIDDDAVDAALADVWVHRQRELADQTDPVESALLVGGQDDDADALGLLLDDLPSEDDVTLPALRAAAATGLRHGLWMGWAIAERLQARSGAHAAAALADTLARADAGTLRG